MGEISQRSFELGDQRQPVVHEVFQLKAVDHQTNRVKRYLVWTICLRK